jgi:hypothetical protein
MPNSKATEVLAGFGPSINFDRGRRMVDAMLVYIEERHRDWFWKGLQSDHQVGSFLRYQLPPTGGSSRLGSKKPYWMLLNSAPTRP